MMLVDMDSIDPSLSCGLSAGSAASVEGSADRGEIEGQAINGSYWAATADDFEALRRQESVFILLNLVILAALVVIHILFQSRLGRPSLLIISLFVGRFAWQALELVWLQARAQPLGAAATRAYASGTVVVHLAFAIVASLASGHEHSHYVVLMVLPTIAAAFRCTTATPRTS
jgi:hypothetical protein